MKTTKLIVNLVSLLCSVGVSFGQGSAFSYQGHLYESGQPANGSYDLRFNLWDAETNGIPLADALPLAGISVTNGQFTAMLDFGGAAFNGDPRWLEVAVRTAASTNDFMLLSPRQAITSTPYAVRAAVASSVATSPTQPLELYVGGARALRLEPTTNGAPNVIGGSSSNYVAAGTFGATIGGGGPAPGFTNARPQFIANNFATICGGIGNCVSGAVSTICGGYQNTVDDECEYSFIGGGYENIMAWGADFGVIAGGETNHLEADWGVVAGGKANDVQDDARFSCIGGGFQNTVQAKNHYSTIAGGANNTIGGFFGSIGGGLRNAIQPGADNATIPGGDSAVASKPGQLAYASGAFASPGDAQSSLYVLRVTTTNTSPRELSLSGDSALKQLSVAPGSRWSFDALIVAGSAAGTTAGFQIKGTIKNVAGTIALVGTPSITPLGADEAAASWSVAVQADDSTGSLVFRAAGDATTIRWVANVRTMELTF